MRQFICCISLCAAGFALSGCGQSGALQLPNDPNYDKRAKYLLYADTEAPKKAEAQQDASIQPVEAPAETESNPTP